MNHADHPSKTPHQQEIYGKFTPLLTMFQKDSVRENLELCKQTSAL